MAESSKSSRVFLLVAVVLGVLATIITFAYLNSFSEQDRGPRRKILVATRELPANTALNPKDDLIPIEVPASLRELVDRAFPAGIDYLTALRDKRINRTILPGHPLLTADLGAMPEMVITPGKVALSLPVREYQALGGLLDPGDWVKIFVTATVTGAGAGGADPMDDFFVEGRGSAKSFRTYAASEEAFRILAVGQRLQRVRDQATVMGQRDLLRSEGSIRSVTLEMSEEQARSVLEKTAAGTAGVTLVLVATGSSTRPAR